MAEIQFKPPPETLLIWDPHSYLHFLHLQPSAALMVTDSGGIQEETTFLGVACFTLWDGTERLITVTLGTNKLIGRRPERLRDEVRKLLVGGHKVGQIPTLWDGFSARRIADYVVTSPIGLSPNRSSRARSRYREVVRK